MEAVEMFKEVVSESDASDIPLRYITAALYYEDGTEQIVYGDELEAIIARRFPFDHLKKNEVQLLLDLRVLAIDMSAEISQIFEHIFEAMKK